MITFQDLLQPSQRLRRFNRNAAAIVQPIEQSE